MSTSIHIVICIKGIIDPDIPSAQFEIDEDSLRVISRSGVRTLMSPFDKQAIEGALRIREHLGEAKITLLSMGTEAARAIIKDGLSLGADEAVLLNDPLFEPADSYTTALTLAKAIRKIDDVDLILTGRQAADWDTGVVGSGIAEVLGLPAVTLAAAIEIDDRTARIERALKNGSETVEVQLPALVTISHELGAPRKPDLRETMRAARKPVTVWSADDIGLAPGEVGEEAMRNVPEQLYIPVNDVVCEIIAGDTPQEKAAALFKRLHEERFL